MRCSACKREFSVAWSQPSPGGSSAPGTLLVVAIIISSITGVLFWVDVAAWRWVGLATAVFVTLQVFVAWGDCGGRGGTCPKCGTEHPVRPWSF